VASDDGFRLKLNGIKVGEFISNRGITSNQYTIFLAKGSYRMDLDYFQGYGLQALLAYYRYEDNPRSYFIGEDSPYLRFSRHP
jgi:hypothetical protein